MHHQDFSGDPPGPGSRKPAYHFRRGSSSAEDHQGQAGTSSPGTSSPGTSSPGTHHQPQVAGAQMKKKSGFQITSVTSAQINVSGNNSLADDTESYDDMDESHTEDLSSSDMLDMSVSKATDTGIPERSSSDETLNSLHGVDTPGLVSPNEPLQPHSISQTSLVNGTMHQHYYPQAHLCHTDEPALPTLPIAPLATSSPAMVSKPAHGQNQRPPALDNTKLKGTANHHQAPVVSGTTTDPHPQGGMNSSVSAAAVPTLGSAGFDGANVTGHGNHAGGGAGLSAAAATLNTQNQHTQTATGSRFRVVKLDTNSEPFRKGRWTCTEYYEKEIPHSFPSDTPKGAEVTLESEGKNVGISPGGPAMQPPHSLMPYQPPTQDFTSPQTIQSPPQATPVAYVSPQEVVGGFHAQKLAQVGITQPPSVIPQQLNYAVDPHQAPQGAYPIPQLRQPDFIQPTAPFQTQVQPPPLHVTTGLTPVPGLPTAQQLVAPPAQPAFNVGLPQTQPQHQATLTGIVPQTHTQGAPYMPLTALQADLQPLLAPGAGFPRGPTTTTTTTTIKTSLQLEDAQKLLLQHQGLLSLPRLGGVGSTGEGSAETSGAAGSLAHMGMSVEASAFMAAAAAGLRSQHGEGDEDSSSGASVVAIDNKIEQAMDLVKSHLMYAVREEVEVLKEQIKELMERNTQLEQENNLLKTLASPEQMAQFQAQVQTGSSPTGTSQPSVLSGTAQVLPSAQSSGPSA
ncbi:unnamed protein product [Ophioblennius macclurei]